MNKRKLILTWCGMGALFATTIFCFWDTFMSKGNLAQVSLYVFWIGLVLGGLMLTFKDDKAKKPKDD
ncbi:MAG TPA: hypothetical protein VMX13_07510 [Sedimentisphaerales bacterium]|nr:hypothetical protein [Sedimentisphaerales bacterium]